MTIKNQKRPALTNAIVWAALIIATALLTMEAPANQGMTLLLLQIAGWYTIDASLSKNGRSLKAEWACLRKRLTGRKA